MDALSLYSGSKMMDLERSTWILVLLTCGVHASATSEAKGGREDFHGKSFLPQCGNQIFNPEKSTCCNASLTYLLSQEVSECCGQQAYNPLNEICCKSVVLTRPTATAQCCEGEAFDVDKQLCCGLITEKVILNRVSPDYKCCGRDQYNSKSLCCCEVNGRLEVKSECNGKCVSSKACQMSTISELSQNHIATEHFGYLCCGVNGSKVMLSRRSAHHQCCGLDQYNTETQCCCEKNHNPLVTLMSKCEASCRGEVQNEPTQKLANLDSSDQHLCCGPNGSKVLLLRRSPHHLCCGLNQFNSSNGSCKIVNGEAGDTGTASHLHHHHHQKVHLSESKQQNKCSTENHCCGNQVYNASSHICCNGKSHTKGNNTQCCGTEAYDIRSPHMKCCMGSLYNVTSKHALCCGSKLQKKEEKCCISEKKQLLYSAKEGLQCCGHLYYNTSLWSCCLGKLTPRQQNQTSINKQNNVSPLVSINNQKKSRLCNKIKLGRVESVSLQSIVFSNVVNIHATGRCIYFLSQHVTILKGPGECIFHELISGKLYFFDEPDVFVNLDHKSIYEALYFILSMCQDYKP